MEHPPIAVFVNGVSAAMNELRPCAPLSLNHILAQELVKGLQAVSDSLVGYNATRVLRDNESALFLSLCRAYIEVAFPHCMTSFGRCYPLGAALINGCKDVLDGLNQLLAVSPVKTLQGAAIKDEEGKDNVDDGKDSSLESKADHLEAAKENGFSTTPAASVQTPTYIQSDVKS